MKEIEVLESLAISSLNRKKDSLLNKLNHSNSNFSDMLNKDEKNNKEQDEKPSTQLDTLKQTMQNTAYLNRIILSA